MFGIVIWFRFQLRFQSPRFRLRFRFQSPRFRLRFRLHQNELQMIPTPIPTPESESESSFDSDSGVGIAPGLSHRYFVNIEIDASSKTPNAVTRLCFQRPCALIFIGDVYVTMQITLLTCKYPAVRFALLARSIRQELFYLSNFASNFQCWMSGQISYIMRHAYMASLQWLADWHGCGYSVTVWDGTHAELVIGSVTLLLVNMENSATDWNVPIWTCTNLACAIADSP